MAGKIRHGYATAGSRDGVSTGFVFLDHSFPEQKVPGRRRCSYHTERGRRVADLTKELKMKFVEESEKCPDKTAKLDAPEDKSGTERSIMIQNLLCYFQKKIRGQWITMLCPCMSLFQWKPAATSISFCLLCEAPLAPLAGVLWHRPILLGLLNYYPNRGTSNSPKISQP